MTTGLILHLGLHVSAHSRIAGTTDLDNNPGLRRRVRSFWAYFSVDRYEDTPQFDTDNAETLHRLITASLGMNCSKNSGFTLFPIF